MNVPWPNYDCFMFLSVKFQSAGYQGISLSAGLKWLWWVMRMPIFVTHLSIFVNEKSSQAYRFNRGYFCQRNGYDASDIFCISTDAKKID